MLHAVTQEEQDMLDAMFAEEEEQYEFNFEFSEDATPVRTEYNACIIAANELEAIADLISNHAFETLNDVAAYIRVQATLKRVSANSKN